MRPASVPPPLTLAKSPGANAARPRGRSLSVPPVVLPLAPCVPARRSRARWLIAIKMNQPPPRQVQSSDTVSRPYGRAGCHGAYGACLGGCREPWALGSPHRSPRGIVNSSCMSSSPSPTSLLDSELGCIFAPVLFQSTPRVTDQLFLPRLSSRHHHRTTTTTTHHSHHHHSSRLISPLPSFIS